ncbi:MAG: ribosome maturation factor RimP [Deltaproteobacteria bacterium]|nr:ribosome maturation factor RimP [Deltaproteobacteria bacterium]
MGLINIEKVRSLVSPVLLELGLELVEARFVTEHGQPTLRLSIDREGGVAVGDCQKVSREIETLLEVEGSVSGRYLLEVSSPGLDRPLVKGADYVRFTGKMAAIKTREPIDGRRNYKGTLQGLLGEEVLILIDGQEYRVPLSLIERAHLVF